MRADYKLGIRQKRARSDLYSKTWAFVLLGINGKIFCYEE